MISMTISEVTNMTISEAVNEFSNLLDMISCEGYLDEAEMKPYENAETILGYFCYKLKRKGIETLEDLD